MLPKGRSFIVAAAIISAASAQTKLITGSPVPNTHSTNYSQLLQLISPSYSRNLLQEPPLARLLIDIRQSISKVFGGAAGNPPHKPPYRYNNNDLARLVVAHLREKFPKNSKVGREVSWTVYVWDSSLSGAQPDTIKFHNETFRTLCANSAVPIPLQCFNVDGAITSAEPELFNTIKKDWLILWTRPRVLDVALLKKLRKAVQNCFSKFKKVEHASMTSLVLGCVAKKVEFARGTAPNVMWAAPFELTTMGIEGAYIFKSDALYHRERSVVVVLTAKSA